MNNNELGDKLEDVFDLLAKLDSHQEVLCDGFHIKITIDHWNDLEKLVETLNEMAPYLENVKRLLDSEDDLED